MLRGEAAHTGRNPINNLSPANDLFDESAGLHHRPARLRREPDPPVLQHHLVKVAASQAVSRKLQRTGHQILTKAEIRKSKIETGKWRIEIRKSKFDSKKPSRQILSF
jgi:hypothetical protein